LPRGKSNRRVRGRVALGPIRETTAVCRRRRQRRSYHEQDQIWYYGTLAQPGVHQGEL